MSHLASLMKSSSHVEIKAEVAGALWALSEAAEFKVAIAASYPLLPTYTYSYLLPPTSYFLQVAIADAAMIPPLVHLLGTGGDRAQHHAASALSSLGLDNVANQVQITQMLTELLISGSDAAQQRAAVALWAQVAENPKAHESIATAGDPAALCELLKHGIPQAKDYALWSLSMSICDANQPTVAEAGGVQALIDQLADGRPLIMEQVSK